MPAVNDVGKPCAGEPHARFDGRELETEHPGQGPGEERPHGKPRGSPWRPVLPPSTATAPAPDPPPLAPTRRTSRERRTPRCVHADPLALVDGGDRQGSEQNLRQVLSAPTHLRHPGLSCPSTAAGAKRPSAAKHGRRPLRRL